MEILHRFFADAKSECDCPDLDDKHRSMAAMKRDALMPLLAYSVEKLEIAPAAISCRL
jgi:hypothetical protein